jgi:hypothetical protein
LKHIAIAIKAAGALTIDQLKVEKIRLDDQAHRLLLRRAHDEGINIAEALEKTLKEAVREYIDTNTIL